MRLHLRLTWAASLQDFRPVRCCVPLIGEGAGATMVRSSVSSEVGDEEAV